MGPSEALRENLYLALLSTDAPAWCLGERRDYRHGAGPWNAESDQAFPYKTRESVGLASRAARTRPGRSRCRVVASN